MIAPLGQATAIHVNIVEAKTRLSELVAAALRGGEVIVQRDGQPKVRLVALPDAEALEREAIAAKRKAAFGFLADKYRHRGIDRSPATAYGI